MFLINFTCSYFATENSSLMVSSHAPHLGLELTILDVKRIIILLIPYSNLRQYYPMGHKCLFPHSSQFIITLYKQLTKSLLKNRDLIKFPVRHKCMPRFTEAYNVSHLTNLS
jgi:hypothetical protein